MFARWSRRAIRPLRGCHSRSSLLRITNCNNKSTPLSPQQRCSRHATSFARAHTPAAPNANTATATPAASASTPSAAWLAAERLADRFAAFGHLHATTNPLSPSNDPSAVVPSWQRAFANEIAALNAVDPSGAKAVIDSLAREYCGELAFEFTHVLDRRIHAWFKALAHDRSRATTTNASDVPAGASTAVRDRHLLGVLGRAEAFDKWMQSPDEGRNLRWKQYSMEGVLSALAAIDTAVRTAVTLHGLQSLVMTLNHRSRLQGLMELAGVAPRVLFRKFAGKSEFVGAHVSERAVGDLVFNYHITEYRHPTNPPTTTTTTSDTKPATTVGSPAAASFNDSRSGDDDGSMGPLSKAVDITIPPNPCHLELVNAVAQGWTRVKQQTPAATVEVAASATAARASTSSPGKAVTDPHRAMCIQVHGDGSFTGQGVVMEALGLGRLDAYTVGGVIHVLLNNQINVSTTGGESRSTHYPSDIAKAADIPVLHVNALYPERVAEAGAIAANFRHTFGRDILVHVIGHRRNGHNELPSEDPAMATPIMQRTIQALPSEVDAFARRIGARDALQRLQSAHHTFLTAEWEAVKANAPVPDLHALSGAWSGCVLPTALAPTQQLREPRDTGVAREVLQHVGRSGVAVPPDFVVHPLIAKQFVAARHDQLADHTSTAATAATTTTPGINYVTAEALATGSLMLDGIDVRITGQDAVRGVYIERHSRVVCQRTGRTHVPFHHLTPLQNAITGQRRSRMGTYEVANSPLGEAGALAYEYGASLATPQRLTVWEAQLGDFYNSGQSVIDGFLCGTEEKWARPSGLTLVLPHGYVGAGPEHSSCRLERFLQLSNDRMDEPHCDPLANDAAVCWHVVNPSSSAQYFHALRRQVLRNFRKPLIVLGPKRLRFAADSQSPLSAFLPGTGFQSVVPDPLTTATDAAAAAAADNVRKVVFVSGQLYLALAAERAKQSRHRQQRSTAVALVRVDELVPFPYERIATELRRYRNAERWVWAQEEPRNQGAWSWIKPRLERLLTTAGPNGPNERVIHNRSTSTALEYVGRATSPVAATGIYEQHAAEDAAILAAAFND